MTTRRTLAAHPGPDRPTVLIGAKLRAARQLRSLTLDQVAQAAGLTKGFVSRLERDDVSPSVASLVAVCDVLGLRVGQLFDPPASSVSRAGEGRLINFGGHGAEERLDRRTEVGGHPGGHPSLRPPSTWKCRWSTLWPASFPVFVTIR